MPPDVSGSKRVVVAGGSGFVGSHVADALAQAGHQVVLFDRVDSPYRSARQEMVVGDLLDEAALRRLVDGAQIVYHFAGIADIEEAARTPARTVEHNVLGTVRLLDACLAAGIERFVYASTVYVFSNSGSFYRSSKRACELFIEDYYREFGLPYTILRYGSLYGSRSGPTNFMRMILEEAVRHRRITYWGSGDEVREYIHIKDAAQLSLDILAERFACQHVILTGRNPMKVSDLFKMISEMLGGGLEIRCQNKGQDLHYNVTPYSFNPNLGLKLTGLTYRDLGLGLLEAMDEAYRHHNDEESPLT